MASCVPRIGHTVGIGIIPLRAVAHFPGYIHSAHPLLHHLRRLRLFPVFFPFSFLSVCSLIFDMMIPENEEITLLCSDSQFAIL